jgi:hypothetical protein
MDKNQFFSWVSDAFLADWTVRAIAGIVVPSCVYYFLWIFKAGHPVMNKKTRRHFFVASAIIVFLGLGLFIHVFHHFDNEIKGATYSAYPPDGRLQAGVLCLMPLAPPQLMPLPNAPLPNGKKQTKQTNEIPATLAGATSGAANMTNGYNMLFVIRVSNSGPPTTAWGWNISAILPNGGKMDVQIPSVSGFTVNAPLPTVYGPYNLKLEDNLLDKLASSPLAFGGSAEGWIAVHLNGLTEVPSGTKFIITFSDVFGKQVKIEHIWVPGT